MPQQPNFILIFPDQWRADCFGYLGHPDVETPCIDELAQDGVTFTKAYSACPTCIATRASLITGQTPSTTGRMGYQDGVPWHFEQTLMRCLRDAGYQTLLSGLTHFFPRRAALGFEEMRTYDCALYAQQYGDYSKSDYHRWLQHETNGTIRDTVDEHNANAWVPRPWRHDERLHCNAWTVDTALELLERRDPLRPFFMQVAFHRPHPPFDPPVRYYEMYEQKALTPPPVGEWAMQNDVPVTRTVTGRGHLPDHLLDRTRKAYYAQMTHLDDQIGRFLFQLEMAGLRDNTWLIFLADHGEMMGDHHMFHKTTPHEASARFPLIMVPPSGADFSQGTHCDTPVQHMDLMPTILEAASVSVPDAVEGGSLLGLLSGEQRLDREFIHGEHTAPNGLWEYVTDGREKYFWESQSNGEWFFDLTKDPHECFNLIDSPEWADRVAVWRDRLVSLLSQRPDDGIVRDGRLVPGVTLPPVRHNAIF